MSIQLGGSVGETSQWLLGGLLMARTAQWVGPMSLRGSSGPLTSVLQATSRSQSCSTPQYSGWSGELLGSLGQCPTELGNWVLIPILTFHLMRETTGWGGVSWHWSVLPWGGMMWVKWNWSSYMWYINLGIFFLMHELELSSPCQGSIEHSYP